MPEGSTNPNDWQTFIQWLAGISVVIGGIVAGWFGTKKSKQPSPLESRYDEEIERFRRKEEGRVREHDDEIERLRVSEAERIKAISDLSDERLRRDFAVMIEAVRQSMRDEITRLEKLVVKNQTDISVLKVVVGLKAKSEDE